MPSASSTYLTQHLIDQRDGRRRQQRLQREHQARKEEWRLDRRENIGQNHQRWKEREGEVIC
jgi:hypothetical protein